MTLKEKWEYALIDDQVDRLRREGFPGTANSVSEIAQKLDGDESRGQLLAFLRHVRTSRGDYP